jgi:hypothetical protein
VSNSCGTADSAVATLTVFDRPPSLDATMSTTTSINITWPSNPIVNHYELWRRSNGANYAKIADVFPPNATVSDGPLTPGTTYVYRVRSVDQYGGATAFSDQDLATTIAFLPISNQSVISFAQFDEVRIAINAIRAANGWGSLAWSAMVTPPVPPPASGEVIQAAHIAVLRARMDEARAYLLGTTQPAYSAGAVAGGAPLAVHITELRSRAQ